MIRKKWNRFCLWLFKRCIQKDSEFARLWHYKLFSYFVAIGQDRYRAHVDASQFMKNNFDVEIKEVPKFKNSLQ